MALLLDHTAPNGAKGNYFRISRINGICAPGEPTPRWEIWVGFYASQDVRTQNSNPLWQYQVNIPFSDLPVDPRQGSMQSFYSAIKSYEPFAGQDVLDASEDTSDISIDASKANKIIEINNARLTANKTSFTYLNKQIACDTLSRSDIDGVNGYVAIMADFPPGWLGKWKTIDNAYVDITTVDDWKQFYAAMVNQGQANFLYSQTLKQKVGAATTIDEVAAIFWGMTITS